MLNKISTLLVLQEIIWIGLHNCHGVQQVTKILN